ncbi:MAG: M48 family metallopeptidase [Cellvibrionaceae bacterium]
MDFFSHQDRARKNTGYLLLLFAAAIIALILITSIFISVLILADQKYNETMISGFQHTWDAFRPEVLGVTSLVIVCIVFIGSLYKIIQLGKGGSAVAEALGGRLLNINTRDGNEKKVLNVVEEMAIASGTPVPRVYLLDEEGINAFAAGFKSGDAVIGVTKGCIERLGRDELQGVIAHEFSHILNGDMGINLRLLGVLNGILVIGEIGRLIMRSSSRSRYAYSSRRSKNSGGIVLIGLGLFIIGYLGVFFGNLIKSAVSRQREFLADASAVQFTRNPDGISGALKKIGGYSKHSHIDHPNQEEFSHFYFGEGSKPFSFFSGWLATHPPLNERITRIEPSWKGKFITPQKVEAEVTGVTDSMAAGFAPSSSSANESSSIAAESIEYSFNNIGEPKPEHLAYASQQLNQLPEKLHNSCHEPAAARAIIYGLLLSRDIKVRETQLAILEHKSDTGVYRETRLLLPHIDTLNARFRLPLIDLCLPALLELSDRQKKLFHENTKALITCDGKIDFFEWSLHRILRHHMEGSKAQSGNKKLKQLQQPITIVFSLFAQLDHGKESDIQQSFSKACESVSLSSLQLIEKKKLNTKLLNSAIKALQQTAPLEKPKLLKALAGIINHDGKVAAEEAELLRAVADSLDCPVPPFISR